MLLNFFLFLAVLIQAAIYWKQLREMRRSLALLDRQAKMQETQSQAMREQVDVMTRQADVMERQLKATEKAADAAYIAQRAYVGVTGVKITCTSEFPSVTAQIIVNERPTLHVTWINGGGTPAEHFRAVPYLSFGEMPEYKGYLIDDDLGDMQFNFIPAGKEITAPYPQAEVGFPLCLPTNLPPD